MASTLDTTTETAVASRSFPRALRTYAFATAIAAGLVVGVGMRFVPPTAAASPDGANNPAPTACAAK